jgi:GT2 family glycosyltransferase
MYFEDNDFCLRLRRAGWKVFYNPQTTITHLGGASLAQDRTRTRYYDAGLRYFYFKHYSPLARVVLEIMLPFYRRMM